MGVSVFKFRISIDFHFYLDYIVCFFDFQGCSHCLCVIETHPMEANEELCSKSKIITINDKNKDEKEIYTQRGIFPLGNIIPNVSRAR